jgi:protein-disulfide isomerase
LFAKEIEAAGMDVELEKIEDIEEIMKFNVMGTPAVVIDGKVTMTGRTPKVKEVKAMIEGTL